MRLSLPSTTQGLARHTRTTTQPSTSTRRAAAAAPASSSALRLPTSGLRQRTWLRRAGRDEDLLSTISSQSSLDSQSSMQDQDFPDDSSSLSPVSRGLAAGVAVSLAIAVAIGPMITGAPSLAMLERESVPLEAALANGKPTVIEFYASWCEVCRDLVPDEYRVEQRYHDNINFVMLNIENSKWAPEMTEYGVGGVPHFVFMDGANEPLAAAVGRLPRKVLEGNVSALAEGRELPFMKAIGQTSTLQQPGGRAPNQANPRDHA